MKNILTAILSVCFTLVCIVYGKAQHISESVQSMSIGANNALTLSLPMYSEDFVDDQWKNFLKDFKGKTRKVKRSSELFTDDAEIGYMGERMAHVKS